MSDYCHPDTETRKQSDRPHHIPTIGTLIALDPDIPPNRQRVSFHAEGTSLRWLMDGKVFAKGPTAQ